MWLQNFFLLSLLMTQGGGGTKPTAYTQKCLCHTPTITANQQDDFCPTSEGVHTDYNTMIGTAALPTQLERIHLDNIP